MEFYGLTPFGMEKNTVEVVGTDGTVVDLHNDSYFRGFAYDLLNRKLLLEWECFWPAEPSSECSVFIGQMLFVDVFDFSISSRDDEIPTDEDGTVEEIVYNDDLGILALRFMSARIMTVKSRTVSWSLMMGSSSTLRTP